MLKKAGLVSRQFSQEYESNRELGTTDIQAKSNINDGFCEGCSHWAKKRVTVAGFHYCPTCGPKVI